MSSPRIERVSSNDLMTLASGSRAPPMQVAAVLLLDRQLEPAALRTALAHRIRAVPRLRQCLVETPRGCGRPIWVDDARFDISSHVHTVACPPPGDESGLLEVAAAATLDWLPRDRPLWSATLVTGLVGNRAALVLVMHHVLADGIGGLAALAQLVDGAQPVPERPFPQAPPSTSELLADTAVARLRAVLRLPVGVALVRDAFAELWTGRVTRAPRCSLNQPTGPRRRFALARVADVGSLKDVAAAHGATVNDVLLVAVADVLRTVLRRRGEVVDRFVVSVPISGRREASTAQLGNAVGVMPVVVPVAGGPLPALASVARSTRARRQQQGRGASTILLAPLFRGLARLRLFQRFVDRQRLVTTFVTNVRGPAAPLSLLGAQIVDIAPVSVITGNITVTFAAMSYAGRLVVTVVVDPDLCPDLPVVASALQDSLDELAGLSVPVVHLEDVGDVPSRASRLLRSVPKSEQDLRMSAAGDLVHQQASQ